MKIEKINDNQIRCTLTRDDLAQRQLKLSELAYGSEKAKSLFREMMQQAASEFGFESDNLPLMIEAIPTAGDSIVLNITKVDDPDELDTRFSRFTPTPADEAADKHKSVLEHLKKLDGAEDFLDILRQLWFPTPCCRFCLPSVVHPSPAMFPSQILNHNTGTSSSESYCQKRLRRRSMGIYIPAYSAYNHSYLL